MGKSKHTRPVAPVLPDLPPENVGHPGVVEGVTHAPAVSAAPTNSALAVIYKAGKPYNVRPGTQQDNERSWKALQALLTDKGGQATRADLQAAVTQYNHVPFVAYAIRRGWLVPVASQQSAAA